MMLHGSILRYYYAIALCDITQAFDKIWQNGLKYKLTDLGLHDCYRRILCYCLADRTAYIKLGPYTGPTFNLKTGVHKGDCLSPTLLNLYVRDIPPPLHT